MSEQVEEIISNTSANMVKAIQHLESELQKVRAGKASPQMVDGVTVEYYGAPTAISQVANVTTTDARTITIQPWENQ